MFDYWFSITYRRIFFWFILLVFLGASAAALYYGDVFRASIEKSLADQRAPASKRPARFVEIRGTVEVKKVGRPEWLPAEKVEELHPGDLIQTHQDSSARIVFFDGSSSMLGPDSLTTIVESHETQKRVRRVAVEVSSGGIDLATGQKSTPEDRAKVMTPDVEASLKEYSEAQARYNREQKESSFYIFSGGAELATREENPARFNLAGREGLTYTGGDNPRAEPYALPAPPKLVSPENAAVIPSSHRDRVDVQWEPVEGIDTYQVTVYPAGISTPVVSRQVKGNRLRLPALREGIYAWQVQSLSPEGGTSRSNYFYKFAIVSQPSPRRKVDIQIRVDRVVRMGDIYQVVGKTDPGVYLEINGELVQVEGNGSFKHFTRSLPPDTTELEIRAKDLSGVARTLRHPLPR